MNLIEIICQILKVDPNAKIIDIGLKIDHKYLNGNSELKKNELLICKRILEEENSKGIAEDIMDEFIDTIVLSYVKGKKKYAVIVYSNMMKRLNKIFKVETPKKLTLKQ